MSGPQWWCSCSAGSPAPSFESAASAAAGHYLWHPQRTSEKVVVWESPGRGYELNDRGQAHRVRYLTRETYLTPDQLRFTQAQERLAWMFDTAFREGRPTSSDDPRWFRS